MLSYHRHPNWVPLTRCRKQAVTTQTQELEALEARLREAEDRLKKASSNSPPQRKDGQRRSPLTGVFPDSPLAQRTAQVMGQHSAGALPTTPSSHSSADYIMVERPQSSQRIEA